MRGIEDGHNRVRACYCEVMRGRGRSRPARRRHEVLGTRELRERLPGILRVFREEGADAEAIVGGANRRPELVMFPYERYLDMMDELDNLSIQALYRERVEGRETIGGRSLEEAARELGFEPEELFPKSLEDDRKSALA